MPGLGAEVLWRLGAIVVTLPGSDIVPALKSGAIDASEWVGPWLDMAMGLNQAARYYYYPGFHEPGTGTAIGINKSVWDSLDASDRQAIDAVVACEYARSLAEFHANNAVSLRKLRDEGTVKIRKFEDTLLRALIKESRDVVADAGARDDLSKKIYLSYEQFRASIMDWSDISERAYLNSRFGLILEALLRCDYAPTYIGLGQSRGYATLAVPASLIFQQRRHSRHGGITRTWLPDSCPAAKHTVPYHRSSETAAVQIATFTDVGPIHDRRAKLLVAPEDFSGKLVAGAGLGDDIFADLGKGLQQGVVELQDFDPAFIPQLAQ